jgi:hypothetical protein
MLMKSIIDHKHEDRLLYGRCYPYAMFEYNCVNPPALMIEPRGVRPEDAPTARDSFSRSVGTEDAGRAFRCELN